jgi:LysM repeat protein
MRYPLISGAVLIAVGFLAVVTIIGLSIIQNIKIDTSKTTQNESTSKARADNSTSGDMTSTASGQPTAVLAAQPAEPKLLLVTVEAGDTLSAIAAENGTTFSRVYDANPELADPHVLHAGQQLRIPEAGETLASRPLPQPVVEAATIETASMIVAPAPATPAPAPVAAGSNWDRLAQCESGGNWAINSGNGYYGGIQFSLATWRSLGGTGLPSEASRDTQIALGEKLLARSGWGQWPACARKLGLL